MCIIVIAALTLIINGCTPVAVGLVGAGLNEISYQSSRSQPYTTLGQEREKITVGNYEISIRDGYFNNIPCVYFAAYNNGKPIGKNVAFDKRSSEDMKMINDFNQMNEINKKKFIKEEFLKISKFDLGPIENVEPEKAKEEQVKSETKEKAAIP